MPCIDDYPVPPAQNANEAKSEAAMLGAVVCGIYRKYPEILDNLDWEQIGISRMRLDKWWESHKARDKAKQIALEKKRKVEADRNAALAKLSDEEKKLLGLEKYSKRSNKWTSSTHPMLAELAAWPTDS